MPQAAPTRSRVVRITPKASDDLPEPTWAPAAPATAEESQALATPEAIPNHPADTFTQSEPTTTPKTPSTESRQQARIAPILVSRSVEEQTHHQAVAPIPVPIFEAQAQRQFEGVPPIVASSAGFAAPRQANPGNLGRVRLVRRAVPVLNIIETRREAPKVELPDGPPQLPSAVLPPPPPPMLGTPLTPAVKPPMPSPDVAPAEVKPPERRVETRRRVEFHVSLDSASNFYAGFAQDLSDGGIFVAVEPLPEIGEAMELAFELDGQPMVAQAVARWVRDPISCGLGVEPGVGMRFVGLHPRFRSRITKFMNERDPLFYLD